MGRIGVLGIGLAGIGLLASVAAIFAAPMGLGIAEEYLFFKWWGLARRDMAILGAALGILGGLVFGLTRLWVIVREVLRNYFKNIALVTASTLVGLVALEIAVRLTDGVELWPPRNLVATRAALLTTQTANEHHPQLGWVLKAGISNASYDPDNSFTTGDYGVRMNAALAQPLPIGGLLAVGDSFTAGSEVGDRHSWPAQLERLLDEPVVNGGVGGWASDQIILRAEELIPIVQPNTVVISFFHDDILRAGYRVYGGANKPWFSVKNGELQRHNNPVPVFSGRQEEVEAPVLGYLHLVSWVLDRVGHGDWWRRVNTSYVLADNNPVDVSCLLLVRLRELTAKANIRLLFVLQYGGSDGIADEFRSEHAELVDRCARDAGIETLDTWEPLTRVNLEGLEAYRRLFVMHDENRVYGHMSSEGNELIARLVADRLRSSEQ